jgi:hypothetical protein
VVPHPQLIFASPNVIWNEPHVPLLVKSLPKTPRTLSEALQFGESHNYNTKQTIFLHRQMGGPKREELYTSK